MPPLKTLKFKDCHDAQSSKYGNRKKYLVTEQLSYNIAILGYRSLK